MMTRQNTTRCAMLAAVLAVAMTATTRAQQPQSPPPAPVPLKIDVVISRLQGDKKTGSLPFTVFVNANSHNYVSLRLGVDVPVGTTAQTTGNERTSGPETSRSTTTTSSVASHVDYRNVGTSIHCGATQLPDGRFSLDLRIQDSSIFTSDSDPKAQLKVADPMAFRTFTFSNNLPMRDGQTMLWATGADKVTGETLKVDVTLAVVK